ncbi:GAF domain-containing protein [bacterium]|nr:GAF domain-containing protein [bacterium]
MNAQLHELIAKTATQFLQTLSLEPLINTALDIFSSHLPENTGLQLHLEGIHGKMLYHKAYRGLNSEMTGSGMLKKGDGLAGQVAVKNAPVVLSGSLLQSALKAAGLSNQKWNIFAGFPLIHQDQLIGVLSIYSLDSDLQTLDDVIDLFNTLTQLFASALHNSLKHEQAVARTRRFVTLSRAITATRQLGTLNEVLEDLTKVLVQSFGFDLAWIGLVNNDKELCGRVGYGQKINEINVKQVLKFNIDKKHPALLSINTKQPVIVPVIESVKHTALNKMIEVAGIQSYGYVPILTDETVIGVMGVFYLEDQPFDEEDAKTLTSVAEQAAIAIENAQLYGKIRTSEENYRTLFQSSGTGLVILNEEFEINHANQAYINLINGDKNSKIDIQFKKLLSANGILNKKIEKQLTNPPRSWEGPIYPKGHQVRQVHFNTTRIPSTGDILVSMIDMTRERELERRLYRSEELASIGELSAGIAHEIRNPLVAITTSASLLKDEPELSEDGQQLIEIIKDESNHLAVIVDDFLRFARPKKPCLRDENINKLMDDLIRRTADISNKPVKLIPDFEVDLQMIAIDRHQILQVMTNLLLNGIHASDIDSSIEIITRKVSNVDGHYICIDINDHGEGIPADEITKIFQPFFSTKERGTGLGLAICRRIIDGHDGEITVESTPGKGARFSVYLPVRFEHQLKSNLEDI